MEDHTAQSLRKEGDKVDLSLSGSQISLSSRPRTGNGKASVRSMTVSSAGTKRPVSAMTTLGHQESYASAPRFGAWRRPRSADGPCFSGGNFSISSSSPTSEYDHYGEVKDQCSVRHENKLAGKFPVLEKNFPQGMSEEGLHQEFGATYMLSSRLMNIGLTPEQCEGVIGTCGSEIDLESPRSEEPCHSEASLGERIIAMAQNANINSPQPGLASKPPFPHCKASVQVPFCSIKAAEDNHDETTKMPFYFEHRKQGDNNRLSIMVKHPLNTRSSSLNEYMSRPKAQTESDRSWNMDSKVNVSAFTRNMNFSLEGNNNLHYNKDTYHFSEGRSLPCFHQGIENLNSKGTSVLEPSFEENSQNFSDVKLYSWFPGPLHANEGITSIAPAVRILNAEKEMDLHLEQITLEQNDILKKDQSSNYFLKQGPNAALKQIEGKLSVEKDVCAIGRSESSAGVGGCEDTDELAPIQNIMEGRTEFDINASLNIFSEKYRTCIKSEAESNSDKIAENPMLEITSGSSLTDVVNKGKVMKIKPSDDTVGPTTSDSYNQQISPTSDTLFNKQQTKEEATYQEQQRQLPFDAWQEERRLPQEETRMNEELDKFKQTIYRKHTNDMDRVMSQFAAALEVVRSAHQDELRTVKEALEIEKEIWINNYKEITREQYKEIARGYAQRVKTLESEAFLARVIQQQTTEDRLRSLKEKFNAEMKQVENSEEIIKCKYEKTKYKLVRMEHEVINLKANLSQLEKELEDSKKITEFKFAEPAQMKDIIKAEMLEQVSFMEQENFKLKVEMTEVWNKHQLEIAVKEEEIAKIKSENFKDLHEVYKSVKTTINNRDSTIEYLKMQLESAKQRCLHLEALLEEQRAATFPLSRDVV